MKKILKIVLFSILIFLLIFVGYFFVGSAPEAEEITWGVNFSQKHAENLGIDWKETYLAILEDLGIKKLKVATYWDLIESDEGEYQFEELDWQIETAENHEAEILLVIGMKTPRWPECNTPEWLESLSKKEQQQKILDLIEKIVLRYRDSDSIQFWQVENEPFFPFGECPWTDKEFLKKEIDLVKSLDYRNRPIVISDSGEMSFWITAARLGDVVGTTMYRKVWFKELGSYIRYPLPPVFYWRKNQIIEKLFDKEVIVVEFQAEPWCPALLHDCSLEEQRKTMDFQHFQKNIEFAKKTGFDEFYLWGAEWIYWLKIKQNDSKLWEEVKNL